MVADRDFEVEKLRYNKRALEILKSENSALNLDIDWGSQELLFSDSANAMRSFLARMINFWNLVQEPVTTQVS